MSKLTSAMNQRMMKHSQVRVHVHLCHLLAILPEGVVWVESVMHRLDQVGGWSLCSIVLMKLEGVVWVEFVKQRLDQVGGCGLGGVVEVFHIKGL